VVEENKEEVEENKQVEEETIEEAENDVDVGNNDEETGIIQENADEAPIIDTGIGSTTGNVTKEDKEQTEDESQHQENIDTSATIHDSDMIEAPTRKILPTVPMLEPVPGNVPKWPFTFEMSAKGCTFPASSSTTETTGTAEQEELEDLITRVGKYHQGSKRKFKPSIPKRKRGRSQPPLTKKQDDQGQQ
ncbi:hypothetical protein ABG067_008144, partial [Albugo candida]